MRPNVRNMQFAYHVTCPVWFVWYIWSTAPHRGLRLASTPQHATGWPQVFIALQLGSKASKPSFPPVLARPFLGTVLQWPCHSAFARSHRNSDWTHLWASEKHSETGTPVSESGKNSSPGEMEANHDNFTEKDVGKEIIASKRVKLC